MRLNLEECYLEIRTEEKKNKHNNWVVHIHCGCPEGKSMDRFKGSCSMIYQFGFSCKGDAESSALCKFIQDRFNA